MAEVPYFHFHYCLKILATKTSPVQQMERPAIKAVKKVVDLVERGLSPFGKFEQFTAGFCMAMPFFLLIADSANGFSLWYLLAPAAIIFIPLFVPRLLPEKSGGNYGVIITVVGGIVLFGVYLLFSRIFGFESRCSISDYVVMCDSHIFGMLLAIAAMLFIVNGAVYWRKQGTYSALPGTHEAHLHLAREYEWRSVLNVALGILLLLVVVFPVTTMRTAHYVAAILFFFGCGAGTIRRESRDAKRVQHRMVDFVAVAVMAAALLFSLLSDCHDSLINLFGAESIALWITGFDFILVSLKRR